FHVTGVQTCALPIWREGAFPSFVRFKKGALFYSSLAAVCMPFVNDELKLLQITLFIVTERANRRLEGLSAKYLGNFGGVRLASLGDAVRDELHGGVRG